MANKTTQAFFKNHSQEIALALSITKGWHTAAIMEPHWDALHEKEYTRPIYWFSLPQAPLTEKTSLSPEEIFQASLPVDYAYTWEESFQYIEKYHVQDDPHHWRIFLKSVREYGVKQPLQFELQKEGFRLIDGHHRLWGAKKGGRTEVPVSPARLHKSLLIADIHGLHPLEEILPHMRVGKYAKGKTLPRHHLTIARDQINHDIFEKAQKFIQQHPKRWTLDDNPRSPR